MEEIKHGRQPFMSARYRKAMSALLAASNFREASEISGMSESTLRNYLDDPEFSEEYDQRTKDLVRDACTQGKKSMRMALDTLREVCGNKEENSQVRVSAARSLMEYTLRLIEISDLDERVKKLEEAQRDEIT